MSGGFRVGASDSVPASVRKTIQNIKEIAGSHSDDDIYAMLKECNMDPNETAQKLLLQDTFHEVKRKRDKKKENVNKEPGDHRWRAGTQGRGGRVGRGSLPSRYASHDAAGGHNSNASKENGITQTMEKGVPLSLSSSASHISESKLKSSGISSPISETYNGSTSLASETSHGQEAQAHGMVGSIAIESLVDNNNMGSRERPPSEVERRSGSTFATRSGHVGANPIKNLSTRTPPSLSGVYSSSSDPVLHPVHGSRVPGVVGAIKREVGNHRINHEAADVVPTQAKLTTPNLPDELHINKRDSSDVTESEKLLSLTDVAALETGNSSLHGAEASKPLGVERNLLQEDQSGAISSQSGPVNSRLSSNYSSRSHPLTGPQKAVGPSKEWKPKPMISTSAQLSGNQSTSGVVTNEVNSQALPSQSIMSEEATSKLQKKLEEFHFSDGQHVIIPNHLQVSESERCTLSFGSFGANFELSGVSSELDDGKASTRLSESSHGAEESAEGPSSSISKESSANEGEYLDAPQSASHVMENLQSTHVNVSQNTLEGLASDQSKTDASLAPGGPQYSMVQAAPNYSRFGLIPPIPGNQFPPLESSGPHSGDISRLPNFVVQQPFDPSTSYYTPFYGPDTDGDARFTQLIVPGSGAKYNGNIAVLSVQSASSIQESGSLVLSSTGASPVASQSAGVTQSSIAVNQQPLPVFRQPAGMHLSHYTPNYLQYNQYFPPLYVPPPSIHHFLSNTAFPQQPPAGVVYPPPAGAPAAPVKYSLSQYKPGTNAGSATNVAMPTGYGTYISAPAGFSPCPAVTTGNSTTNEDVGGSQFKENNVYIAGQQGEGSGVWVPAPSRDVASLPASLFYNLPPQGQMTFGPSQSGHGAFAGIFHPAQTMAGATVHPLLQQSQTIGPAVEVVGPQPAVYQQPQRAQVNWASNY